jgi:BlaR1 peptidase M56
MLTFVLEAAMRSLLMALAVWTAIRLLRVQAVFAQKVAWVLVLMAAGAMPLVMHTPWLALNRALRIPLRAPALPFAGTQAKTQASATEGKNTFRAIQMTRLPNGTESAQTGSIQTESAQTGSAQTRPAATHTWHSSASGADAITLSQRVMHLPVPDMDLVVRTPVMNAAAASYWNAQTIRQWSVISYLAIVGLLLLRALAGAAFAWRVWRRATPSGIGGSLTPPVRVRVSKDIATPITVASTILLPADYRTWDDAKLRVVLAHEQSHVRQGDFYLQLLAAAHVAVFWFSPLGWWLKSKLSELGEALSDRAGLEQAPDPATYAQVLLEFAAMPRRAPLAGVAMARSSNLSGRIERILNDRRFRLAFLGGRRHAILTALLVPATLVAVVACIRIVPAVEAAQARQAAVIAKPAAGVKVNACSHSSTEAAGQIAFENVPLPENPDDPTAATTFARSSDAEPASAAAVGFVQAVPAAPAGSFEAPEALTLRQRFVLQARANFAPLAFMVPGAQVAPAAPVAPVAPVSEAVAPVVPVAPVAPVVVQDGDDRHHHSHVVVNHDGDDGDKFSIVHENGDGTLRWNGEYNDDLARVQKKMNLRGDYIYFEHDGKSYVVTDPAILSQANRLFEPNHDLERMQARLDAKQAELNKRMEQYSPDAAKIKVDSPEMKKKMAELNAKLAELQSESFKKMTVDLNKQINQEVLSNLQEKMGDIQSQIGELQGQIGEEMGRLGEKQGEIGEEMGRIGEEMGRIGEQQGRIAEEASRKMNSVLDQALRDGKAKPVE